MTPSAQFRYEAEEKLRELEMQVKSVANFISSKL